MDKRESRNLYLHVGPWKTGSTSIQAFLKQNSEELRHQGYLFPWSGLDPVNFAGLGANHSTMLSASLQRDQAFSLEAKHGAIVPRMERSRAIDLLAASLQNDFPNVILSGEDAASLSQDDFRQLVDLASKARRTVAVLGLSRDPSSYVSSMAQQLVMARRFTLGHLLANPPFPKFRLWFEKLIAPDIRTTIRDFLPSAGFRSGPLGHLAQWLSLPNSLVSKAELFSKVPRGASRSMLSVISRSALLEFSESLRLSEKLIPELERELRKISGPSFELPAEFVRHHWDLVKKDVDWMHNEFGISYESPVTGGL